jgi:hypothetical protein
MRHLVYLLLVANLAYFAWSLLNEGVTGVTQRELPPLPASARPLVTLQEMQQQATIDGQDATEIDALTMTEPPGAIEPAACQALGPFYVEEEMQALSARLDALGLEPRQRISEDRKQNGYWVYLPAMERAQALQIARRLDALNDHDYYIGKDNYMSLGMFTEITRAEIRLRQMQELGIPAILEARHEKQEVYWLEFREAEAAMPIVNEELEGKPGLELHALNCM